MMPSRSTSNLREKNAPLYTYEANFSRDDDSPPPAPPVRDSSTLKSIKYGPGHEKFPSWPVPAAAEAPKALRGPPSGGSHRSKSWTDHTNYPKEKVMTYTRPYMKRQHSSHTNQKLKTVMERCEKISPEAFTSRYDKLNNLYLSHKHPSLDYMTVPERDVPALTQADLEEYARSYQEPKSPTLEDFMEYNTHLHQKQLSYAQSEGYHSYVSSTDSTSTPFLDRLRRDSEAAATRTSNWEEEEPISRREGRDSVVTTSSGSVSSSETLKWHGSMSDVSVTSSCTHGTNSRQLIAHSARVQTPQRHHSESVLYMGSSEKKNSWKDKEKRNNSANKLKLFPVNTYTMQEKEETNNRVVLSVADRITELEKQQKFSYFDPDKKHKVPDPTLKAIQKKALLSFYERHQNHKTFWRSEPYLAAQQQLSQAVPQPPPRVKTQLPSRRASSASDYANASKRSSLASTRESKTTDSINRISPKHQYSNSCGSLSADLLGPIIVGSAISIDDYVPEKPPARPPKNPHLRTAFPDLFAEQRIPSPDLPPPSPPTVLENEVFCNDEPLPPPPPECEPDWQQELGERLKESSNEAGPQVEKVKEIKQTVGLPEQRFLGVRSSIKTRSSGQIIHQVSGKPLGFPNQQAYAERAREKFPAVVLNGNIAVSQKVIHGVSDQYRAEPLKAQDLKRIQRASIAETPTKDVPPPLQPRQSRFNQSMRARISHIAPRASPPKDEQGLRETRSHSLSQSKASYLAFRRDRIVPDSETGSYKRTMSPNGHSTTPETSEPAIYQKDPHWPLSNTLETRNNNNTHVFRRSSMSEKPQKSPPKIEEKEEKIKKSPVLALPDVLPVNAKLLSESKTLTPPSSPTKTPTRSSPFAPIRTLNPPLLASFITSSPVKTNESPPSPKIKPSLSPTSPPIKLSPLRGASPNVPSSPKKPEDECPKVVEGLQLIQRTEVVLRVNTTTTDAAIQTEKDELPPTPMATRKKLQEEIECDKLTEELVNHLPTSDRLKEILVPAPEHKKPSDYVQGLFRVEITSRPKPLNSPFRSRSNTPSSSPPPTSPTTKIISTTSPTSPLVEPTSPLSGSSTYFTISEPKARFLTRYSQDMNQCYVVKDTKDLTLKKEELVTRLDRKLEVLRSEHLLVSEECKVNEELGENVEAHIRRLARPHEADKFRLHIEEVGKITSLLLGLSGRLARAENALLGMPDEHPEKRILESKRDKLLEQLEEAKKLKECIDRRSVNVSKILYKYLNPEEYTDYDHFINMKAKLIMDAREIADKIKLGEEQLSALKEALIITD